MYIFKKTGTRARKNIEARTETIESEQKKAKQELKKLIKTSKRARWQELCDKLEDDIWIKGYSIVTGGLQITPVELSESEKVEIAMELFPRRDTANLYQGLL